MDSFGSVIGIITLFVLGGLPVVFSSLFVVKVFKGKWEKRGVMLADTIRKFAKGFCVLLAVLIIVALFMAIKWGYEFSAFLVVIASYPIICALVLFGSEIFASRLEAQIKTGDYARKIYNQMLKQSGKEPEPPVNTDGKLEFKTIKKFFASQNQIQEGSWPCTACGKQNVGSSKFCVSCGKAK